MPMLDQPISNDLLTIMADAFDQEPGYHGTCWWDRRDGRADRPIPKPLAAFLEAVRALANRLLDDEVVGTAYLRVIDAGKPENYMRWHRDCADGGVRFTTTLATDDAPVNLAWPDDASYVGRPTADTPDGWWRPRNGRLLVFTTEAHGVPVSQARPGERTAVFFTTLYRSRAGADLYLTNNAATDEHATLHTLEATR